MARIFRKVGRCRTSAPFVLLQQEVDAVDDERLKMLRWQHLKVELDDRANEWPKNSRYEFDQNQQVVTWHFARQNQEPGRLVAPNE